MEKNIKNYDAIIVGGGSAGLMLARELSKLKHNVLIIDKNKNLLDFTFYTLASFMKPKNFGLTDDIIAQKINGIYIKSSRFSKEVECECYTIDKRKLHEELIDSLNLDYVDFKLETQIVNIHSENNIYTSVEDKKGIHYIGKLFFDCTGTKGFLSKKVGLLSNNYKLATGVEYNVEYLGNTNKIYLLLGKTYKGGYGWIFPLKNNRAIIGFGTINDTIKKDLKKRLHEIIELPEIKKLVKLDTTKIEGGSIPITPVIEKFVSNNLVCVGDSVSQVNPIAGEGYKFILESALIASKYSNLALLKKDFSLLNGYEQEWKKRFSANYKRSKIAQKRIHKLSKSDIMIDLGILLSKLRSNQKNLKSLSGEYY